MDKLISRPALCWIILSQEWLKSGSAYLWISLFWDQFILGSAYLWICLQAAGNRAAAVPVAAISGPEGRLEHL
jgi:hypothetical protein